MNPIFKAWLLETLQRSAGSGGLTFFEEILNLLETDRIMAVRDACNRILKARTPTVTVKAASVK